jgi:hypothetical protein
MSRVKRQAHLCAQELISNEHMFRTGNGEMQNYRIAEGIRFGFLFLPKCPTFRNIGVFSYSRLRPGPIIKYEPRIP